MSAELDHGNLRTAESFHTIVIGGGQAGLAAGHFLAQQQDDFIILDKNSRSGDAWRCRWESLRLFTPSQFNNLPGMPFAKEKNTFPSKDEVADYLDAYAAHFRLPVRHNVAVEELSRDDQGYRVHTQAGDYLAENVIVATGPYQKAYTPEFAGQLDGKITQLHTSGYFNPRQIQGKSVLVVGAGNSGVEIALELARNGIQVWLSGRDVGRVPANSPLGKLFDGRLVWWLMTHALTVDTPMGRKMQAAIVHRGTPLGRANREEVTAAGVTLCPRMRGVNGGKPQLEDGQVLPVDVVLWATGFKPDYAWIHLPVLNEQGYPVHTKGVAQSALGLYFVGLPFQSGLSSSLLGGVGKDAAYIASQVFSQRI